MSLSTSTALIPYTPPISASDFIKSEAERGLAKGSISHELSYSTSKILSPDVETILAGLRGKIKNCERKLAESTTTEQAESPAERMLREYQERHLAENRALESSIITSHFQKISI
ncbi:MAG: hypothetical protein WAM28_07880 [Chlamydiales bacterium]